MTTGMLRDSAAAVLRFLDAPLEQHLRGIQLWAFGRWKRQRDLKRDVLRLLKPKRGWKLRWRKPVTVVLSEVFKVMPDGKVYYVEGGGRDGTFRLVSNPEVIARVHQRLAHMRAEVAGAKAGKPPAATTKSTKHPLTS